MTAPDAAALTEQWRPVEGWPNYDVSSEGRVRSRASGQLKIIKQCLSREGYLQVVLYRATTTPAQHRTVKVHRLIGEVFLGPRPDGLETRHLNGVQTDNRVANLAYGTKAENARDQILHGTNAALKKTHCPRNHPYDEVNTYVTPDGRRDCRACARRRKLESAQRDAVA